MSEDWPPIQLWIDRGKGVPPGPNDLQKMYFIDRVSPDKRPHLHTQDILLSIGGQGSGKCLKKDTPILMYDGQIIPVQDVKVGDLVMGPDSKPRTVLSLGRGRETMYKITPVKGDPFVCNESHVLSLKNMALNCHEERFNPVSGTTYIKPPRYGGVDVINVSISDYLSWSSRKKQRFGLYRSECLDFNPVELPLDPYFLGLWLGDGSSHEVGITTMDNEIKDYIYDFCSQYPNLFVRTYTNKGSKASTYTISSGNVGGGKNNVFTLLKNLNLINNKHIPHSYKTASVEDRLQLLAGLIDTDGSTNNIKSDLSIVQKRKHISEDIAFIARSLGFAAYIKEDIDYCYYKGEKREGTYYRVSISGDLSRIPTKLPRKQFQPRKQKKRVLVSSISIEKLPEDDFYGFSVDGDHLFLLGDFTVVHNSVGAVARMIDQARLWPGIQIYLGAFNMKVLARNIWQPFEEILLDNRNRKKRHPFLEKSFGENSQYAKFANGSSITCINLETNIKENIGFTAGLLVIDEVHLLPDEEALKLLIGRARGIPPQIRQVLLCTNPEKTKQGWINQSFDLKQFDGVDTSEGPVQKLVGPRCRCQFCTNCRATFKKEVEWVKVGNEMICPNCNRQKDSYTWKGEKFWCPGDQQYWRVIKSETHHNPQLPDDYYQGMEDMYDPVFFDIMVKGQMNTDLREDYVYNKYNEAQLLPEFIDIDWDRPIYWGMDFNLQPECSVICQYEEINGVEKFIVKHELVLYGHTEDYPYGKASAKDVANAFVKRYKEYYRGAPVYLFFDPHGYGGQTDRELTRPATIHTILSREGFLPEICTDDSPMPLKERTDTLNEVCDTLVLMINPEHPDHHFAHYAPRHVLLSLQELKWKDKAVKDTLDVKGDDNARRATRRDRVYCMTHPTDALSYIVYEQFNILKDLEPAVGVSIVGKSHIYMEPDGSVQVEKIDAPEASKQLEERLNKKTNEARETPASKARREEAAKINEEIERINNQSMGAQLRGMGINIFFNR